MASVIVVICDHRMAAQAEEAVLQDHDRISDQFLYSTTSTHSRASCHGNEDAEEDEQRNAILPHT